MNRNNKENYGSNPLNPSYSFNGNNTNYNFLLPGTYDLRLNMPQNQQARNPNLNFHSTTESNTNVFLPNSVPTNVPASPARVQVFGNQPGTPSPMQRGFAASTPPPGSSSPGIHPVGTSTNGPNAPPGTPTFINTASGTASPQMMNLQGFPMKIEGFGSPAPPARFPGNSSAEDIHPQTPRPRSSL